MVGHLVRGGQAWNSSYRLESSSASRGGCSRKIPTVRVAKSHNSGSLLYSSEFIHDARAKGRADFPATYWLEDMPLRLVRGQVAVEAVPDLQEPLGEIAREGPPVHRRAGPVSMKVRSIGDRIGRHSAKKVGEDITLVGGVVGVEPDHALEKGRFGDLGRKGRTELVAVGGWRSLRSRTPAGRR